jgi:hypothetical protein
MRANSAVNPLRDMIRVRYQILAPDGGWLQWVIGLFMWTAPVKEIHEGYTWWSASCPDLSQFLSDDSFHGSISVAQGTDYAAAASTIIQGFTGPTRLALDMKLPGQVLPAALSWDIGMSRLKAVNDLLVAINYIPVSMRLNTVVAVPRPDYNRTVPIQLFDTVAGRAIVAGPFNETPDYSGAYNQFLVTTQDPRRIPLSYYYENALPESPISLVNWHPRLKVINDSSLASAAACQQRALSEAQAAARIYSALSLALPPWPWFEDLDIVQLVYSAQDEGLVSHNYLVTAWTHTCATMPTSATFQRIVAA